MKKTVLLPLSALAVVALFATLALAAQPGPGKGMGPGGSTQLTAEQQDAARAVFDKYQDKAEPLQVKLYSRSMELQALVNSGTTDRKAIQDIVQEMHELRTELRDLRSNMHEDLTEATGMDFGYGRGWGMGQGAGFGPCGGPGSGYGPGQGMGQGYGPGHGMGPGNGRGFGPGNGPCWQ